MKSHMKKTDLLFVIPPYHRRKGSGALFPLGIGAIMACLEERGITFEYVDCTQIVQTLYPEDLAELKRRLTDELDQYDPVLVGIGPCVTPGVRGLEVLASCCLRRFRVDRVFAGGPFTSLPSQEWFFYEHLGIKHLIKGEGELAVCEAIEIVKSGYSLSDCNTVSVPGRSYINIVEDINSMPFPKRVQLEKDEFSIRRRLKQKGKTAHIVASRGCPYHCDYCVSGNLKISFRRRSSDSIVAEMKMLSEKYGVTDIVFYDDCFFTSAQKVHSEIKEFCISMKKANLNMTWQIEIRPDILVEISDGELEELANQGCRQMNIGVEKTYADGASVFGKRYDYNRLRDYLAHAHIVCPIRMTGTFILGGKGETIESVRQLIDASATMNLDEVEYSPLFVYPDTPIYGELFDNPKAWFTKIINSQEPWGEVVYETDNLDIRTLIDLVDEAYRTFAMKNDKSDLEIVKDRYHLRG